MIVNAHPIYAEILALVREHRFATTHQLTRLTMHMYGNRRSAIRQTLRHLRALQQKHLITKLERRVGGWQGGSQVAIWTLTTKGHRQLTGNGKRLRPHHFSTTFLEHSLAVTEAQVLLHESARSLELQLMVKGEPACWRRYLDPHGHTATLKPDLAVTVTSNEFIDRYFIEVDRATENPARVIRKCWQYAQHRRTGNEQSQHEVYPAVIWFVPNEHRKQQLLRSLTAETALPRELFHVLTASELMPLVRDGPTHNP